MQCCAVFENLYSASSNRRPVSCVMSLRTNLVFALLASAFVSIQSLAETPPPSTTSAPTAPPPANGTCVDSFKSKFPVVPSSFIITGSTFPVTATITIGGNTYASQNLWVVNTETAVTSNTIFTTSMVYTYEYVTAKPSVATGIIQTKRLNQFAFLLNNVVVGTTVATPNAQVWWSNRHTGCTTISASDLQVVFWALTQANGQCDMNPAYSVRALCSNGVTTPNICNVAYLWNLAFANVPEGAAYHVPSTYTSQPVIYPLVLVPQTNSRRAVDSAPIEVIVVVDVNSWGINPQCLNNTCVSAFKQGFPSASPYFEITGSVQPLAYVEATVEVGGITHTNQGSYCVDYLQAVYSGSVYTDSPVYAYEYVIANPSVVPNVDRPIRLNQVAYLMNNVFIRSTVATGPQVWWGITYTGCTTISASDFQAAIWALVQSAGECDMERTAAYGYVATLCTNTIDTPNTCNVAYLWNLAFANVPDGTNYSVTVRYSPYPVIYPLVLSPTVTPTTQVQIIAVVVNSWGVNPQCCVPWATGSQCCSIGGYYYLAGSTVALPCRAGYYCPNASTPTQIIAPIKCPAGYYCPTASCSPIPCPCGSKCPAGSSAPITCQPPYYCPAGSKSQTLCPLGYMCPNPGMCSPIPCAPGTYVSCAGKVLCSTCPAGRYCPSVTNQSILCPAGYFCQAGSSAKTICPVGYFCHVGSAAATPCPQGSYLPTKGGIYHSSCLHCAAGKYQNAAGGSVCIPCPIGTYQPKTNSTACKTCSGAAMGATSCASRRLLGSDSEVLDAVGQVSTGETLEGKREADTTDATNSQSAPQMATAVVTEQISPSGSPVQPLENPSKVMAGEGTTQVLLTSAAAAYARLTKLLSAKPATENIVSENGLQASGAAVYALLTMTVMVGTALSVRRLFK